MTELLSEAVGTFPTRLVWQADEVSQSEATVEENLRFASIDLSPPGPRSYRMYLGYLHGNNSLCGAASPFRLAVISAFLCGGLEIYGVGCSLDFVCLFNELCCVLLCCFRCSSYINELRSQVQHYR